jgi:hypothetical protein
MKGTQPSRSKDAKNCGGVWKSKKTTTTLDRFGSDAVTKSSQPWNSGRGQREVGEKEVEQTEQGDLTFDSRNLKPQTQKFQRFERA